MKFKKNIIRFNPNKLTEKLSGKFRPLLSRFRKTRVGKTLVPKNLRKMPKWKKALFYLLYFGIAMLFILVISFAWFAKDLPTPTKIANMHATESTKLFDRTGTVLIYETGDQKRTIVQGDQISQYLKDAEVSTEDANFYNHHGFDVRAVMSAVVEKITGKRSIARGGSTITQQYVKNAMLTSNRSFIRKFKELILAIELEFMYNKDEILTMYLNEIPYGNSTAGAEAASKLYYGKPAKELTLAQAATLAAIPKAPTYYSPYGTHTDALIKRKEYVLDRMVSAGKISKEEADIAKVEDTTTLGVALNPRKDIMLAPHFSMYVLEQIADQYGEEKIQKEGLKIITSLDYDKQKIAEEAVTNGSAKFSRYGASNGAMVAVDPKTGQILAMVGSKDFFDTKIDGNVNVADSARQPGSSFKPFSYATAFKQPEYSPSKVLFDLQTDFGGGYVPRNYNGNFNGPVTMRQALSNSLNIPAVKTMSLAGIDNVIRTATDMGITTLTDRSRYGLSLALGAAEVKPVEMASAFGVFANGGIKNDITPILKITDPKGKTLYDFENRTEKGKEVLDPQIAYEISNILSDNKARALVFGTRSALAFPDRVVAAKTGTTSDFKDAWTMGYTPSVAVAVWVGNSNGVKMSSGADGSVVAAPIFHQYIEKSLAGTPSEDFMKPEGIQTVTVEKFSNKLPSDYSIEKNTDIFASWQVPKEKDNVNINLRVCKSNGKLAPDGLPDALVDQKVVRIIHSEKPDNPNWENPVRAWAEGNGFYTSALTEYCDASATVPELLITSPTNGANLSNDTTILAKGDKGQFSSVEFYIDDVSIGSASSDNNTFSKSFNFGSLSLGNHKITVSGKDSNGISATGSITINVDNNSSSLTISGLSATPTANSASIIWTTSTPATSQIFWGIVSTILSSSNPVDYSLLTNHSALIAGLSPETTYYYKVTSIDGSNNSKTSEVKSFKTPKATP